MAETVEVVRLLGGHPQEVKVRLHEGAPLDVAYPWRDKTRGFGHLVKEVGGTWLPECREIHYEVTVRLEDGDRDYVWLHSFVTPEANPVPHPAATDPSDGGGGRG